MRFFENGCNGRSEKFLLEMGVSKDGELVFLLGMENFLKSL